MNTKLKISILTICLGVLLIGGMITYSDPAGHSTLAYLSDQSEKTNKFTVGHVTAEIVETFNPPSSLVTGTNSYTKKIQVQNGGTVPAYARIWLAFSNKDVEGISKVSCDNGSTWYSLSDLRNHLPSGWVYQNSGTLAGYYYYTSPVKPGKKTPVLITNVKTDFINKTADTNQTINKTKRDYDVMVYAEAVQQAKLDGSRLNTSYETAWKEFLAKK